MRLSGEAKFFVGVIVGTIAILIAAIFFFSKPQKEISQESLISADSWATGSAQPKVTLVEFADFECPACGSAYPFVKETIENHKDTLQYVFRHFPLEQHKNARLAAAAAEAAGAQGKFWEMHDLLFKNQTDLSQEKINGLALELKLDMERFTKEISDNTYTDKIEADIAEAIKIGVNSTPSFFLNGKKLSLFNFNQLSVEVEKAITASGSASQ